MPPQETHVPPGRSRVTSKFVLFGCQKTDFMNLNCALNMVSPQNLQQWVYTAKILLNIVYTELSINVKIES